MGTWIETDDFLSLLRTRTKLGTVGTFRMRLVGLTHLFIFFKHEMKLGATKSASKHKKYKFTLGGGNVY